MAKVSAGLLLYRLRDNMLEVFLAHPGGPFWARKDLGAWTIPKGEVNPGEELLAAARREFFEETSFQPPPANGEFILLTPVRLKSGKTVHAWAFRGNCDPAQVKSIDFEMEWPPRSGIMGWYPEVDRAAFFSPAEGKQRINPSQAAFISELERKLGLPPPLPRPNADGGPRSLPPLDS